MTKTLEEKERFVFLRAQGLSFDKIAEEMDISKPTLIKWHGEMNEQVKKQQYFVMENILNQYQLMRRNRFEKYSRLLNSVFQELENKVEQQELSELSVPELLKLAEKLETRLSKDTEKPLLKVNLPEDWSFSVEETVEL
jgi:ATP/maltotriose-dependent transcriptional regulator MalT